MYGYVYITTNTINGKKYIGKKVSPVFVPSYKGSGKILRKAIAKYGKDNFATEILQAYDSKDALEQGERDWISACNAVESDDYYNLSRGGNGFDLGISEELLGKERYASYIQHLSEGVARSYSTVEGLRELRSKHMKEQRKHMRYTQDSHRRTSAGTKAWYASLTPEEKKLHRDKAVATYKAHYSDHTVWDEKTHPWIGKHHSEETKKKLSEYGKKLVGSLNPHAQGGYVTYQGRVVFTFSVKRDAYAYLKSQGLKKREYLSMAHGDPCNGYQIHTESATTIENEVIQ